METQSLTITGKKSAGIAMSAPMGVAWAFVAVVCVVLFGLGIRNALLISALAITGLALGIMQNRCGRTFPTPIVPVAALILTGSSAYVFYPLIQSDAIVSLQIPYKVDEYRSALFLYLISALALCAGSVISLRQPRLSTHPFKISGISINGFAPYALVLSIIPIFLVLAGFGLNGLLRRSHYLEIAGSPGAVSLSLLAMPIGGAALIFITLYPGTKLLWKCVAALILILYVLVYLGTGSRGIGLVSVLFGITWIVVRRSKKVVKVAIALMAGWFSLMLISAVLQLRVLEGDAGIVPAISFMTGDDFSWTIRGGEIFGNILFGLPLAGQIMQVDRLPMYGFWTSVTPLPSSYTRWEEFRPYVSWANATPYNALGELYDYGLAYVLVYMFTVGVVLGLIDNFLVRFPGVWNPLITFATTSAGLLFSTGLFQYPLRNTTRYLWYLIFAMALIVAVMYFKRVLVRKASLRSYRVGSIDRL